MAAEDPGTMRLRRRSKAFRIRQHQAFSVEDAIKHDIIENANFAWAHAWGGKNVYDVNCFVDFWSFVRLGFLPLIIQQEWFYSEDFPGPSPNHTLASSFKFPEYHTPTPVRNDYLRFSRILGGIRMRQETRNYP